LATVQCLGDFTGLYRGHSGCPVNNTVGFEVLTAVTVGFEVLTAVTMGFEVLTAVTMGFEVLTAVTMKSSTFWDMTTCSLGDFHRRFVFFVGRIFLFTCFG
jgi:hypothetical protein